jgi:hypothetical protein
MQESLKHFAKRYFWGLFIINKCKFDWFFDLASTCTSDFYTSYGFIGILHSSNSFLFYSRIYPKMKTDKKGLCIMVFNITFNNISVVSWQSVLVVEETGVPGENQRPCRKSLTNFIA